MPCRRSFVNEHETAQCACNTTIRMQLCKAHATSRRYARRLALWHAIRYARSMKLDGEKPLIKSEPQLATTRVPQRAVATWVPREAASRVPRGAASRMPRRAATLVPQ